MLQMENVYKDLGEFILKNVSLRVEDGEYLVIIGPTGSGKTILIETLAGIYAPDKGQIFLDGREITKEAPKDRNICMVYQDYMLFPHLNVEKNIAFGLKARKVPRNEIEERVSKAARLLGIERLLHRYPNTLSGGEQQRAAIARAIVMEPAILLLDEPLSALDGITREKLRKELKSLHSFYKTTVIHVTHNFEEVFSLADKVAVMNGGEIVQEGTPEEVFRRPNCEMVANFVGVENLFRGKCITKGDSLEIEVGGLRVISTACEVTESGEVFASVRPEEILMSKSPLDSSARNSFPGIVEDVVNNGTTMKISVDVGLPFVVILTRQGYQDMDLEKGTSVYLTFKASSVHVF